MQCICEFIFGGWNNSTVYGPDGLYTVARERDKRYLFCLSNSATVSRSN